MSSPVIDENTSQRSFALEISTFEAALTAVRV